MGGGEDEIIEGDEEQEQSVAQSVVSHAPSLHPSIAGKSVVSMACSESTIGAGDATAYWDYQHREANKAE